MDPIALAAVVGLVYAGKKLSDRDDAPEPVPRVAIIDPIPNASRQTYHLNSNDMGLRGSFINEPFPGVPVHKREVAGTFSEIRPDANRNPFGQPVYDLYNRQGLTNKMNNFPPTERKYVGPGLGVGPNVPATGGFQQLFRVMPTNVNEERLVQLEGRTGPPAAIIPSGWTQQGGLTQTQRPPKIYHRDPAKGGAQGQGGPIGAPEARPTFQRTLQPTIKSQTGNRGGDGLNFGTQYFRKDGAYATSANQLWGDPKREGKGRMLPAGRMNVRNDPINQNGAASKVRSDNTAFPLTPSDGSRMGNYATPTFAKFNGYKDNVNPWSLKLDVAEKQLAGNSLAKSIAVA